MDRQNPKTVGKKTGLTAGAHLLARLKTVGIDYIFANSGTDFPPVIEGLAEAAANGVPLPRALTMPHESAAMGMAHGYYLATGKAQAVMAHTNVGLANCAIGAINAATEHVPVLLMSGRTPTLEKGHFGARTVPIGWGQEMRDQTALVREASKWDYELRFPAQVGELVDRAWAVANSTPKGPVYLSLPREVLCEPVADADIPAGPLMAAVESAPSPGALAEAARLIAEARNPVIIAQRGAGTDRGFAALTRIVEKWAIPLVHYWAIQLALPTDHPMAAGTDPAPFLEDADLVLVIDSLAPWSPAIHTLKPGCKTVHLGPDPLYARTPIRDFPLDLGLAGETGPTLIALEKALDAHMPTDAHAARAQEIADQTGAIQSIVSAAARVLPDGPMSKAYVSHCLSEAIAGTSATVLSELGCPLEPLTLREPGSWYQEPHSGGLGWSFPAALGMKLADPEKLIVATMGDGSYMFSNPVACHQIAEALELPILILVLNNAEWGAVRQSVLGVYPNGHAAQTNRMPLTALTPSPDFAMVAAASRAWSARIDNGTDLPGLLREAIEQVSVRKRTALIDIGIAP